ncbi:MAG TPA: hypothetical protein VK886_21095 [Vicinamibacterales bacterium]|nr:hypothetical protein [Vicinamibacterales bacterium]
MQPPPSPPKLQPALLGGVFMGVLSALPFISYANACCCLWVVVGGLLAAWLLQQNHPYAITTGDGALVGLLAGLCGAVIGTVVGLLMSPFQQQIDLYLLSRLPELVGDVPPMVEEAIAQRRQGPALNLMASLLGLVISLIINPIFAMLGGLLGAALFKKGDQPPAPWSPVSPADLPPAP